MIDNNRDRKPKRLWSELGAGDPVEVVEVEDEHAEARFVAAEIARLVVALLASEMAVFCRTNAQSRVLEDVLVRQQVHYQVIGGPRFCERRQVKDAVLSLSSTTRTTQSLVTDRQPPETRHRGHDGPAPRVARADARDLALGRDRGSGGGRGRDGRRPCDPQLQDDRRVAHVGRRELEIDELVEAVTREVEDDRGLRGGADDRGAGSRTCRSWSRSARNSGRASTTRPSPASSRRCSSSPTRTRSRATPRR